MNNKSVADRLLCCIEYLNERCLLAVVFFLPLSLDISSFLLAAGGLIWAAKMIVHRRTGIVRTPFDWLIAILIVLSAMSIWQSPDRIFSGYNFVFLMGRYLLIYYLISSNVKSICQLKQLVVTLLGSALLVAVYGFYQYIFGADISAFEWVDYEQFPDLKLRVFSTLKNPNLLAGFLVVVMALAAGIGFKTKERQAKLATTLLVVLFGSCLALTYSRGAWISIVAVVVVFGLVYKRRILWLLTLIPLLIFIAQDVWLHRLMSIINPTDTSSTLRIALWESTVAMIIDKPLTGIGWGAYWLVYPQYDFFINDATTKIFHAHNMYLNIAAEIGLPGLVIFLVIMYSHIRKALTITSVSADYELAGIMLGVAVALIGLAVSGLTDYIMFNIQLSMIFWLLNALVVVAWRFIK